MCCRGPQAPLNVQLLKPVDRRFPARIHRVPLRAPAMNRRPQAWRSRRRACAATAVLLGFLTVAAVRAEAEADADVRALLARRCISNVGPTAGRVPWVSPEPEEAPSGAFRKRFYRSTTWDVVCSRSAPQAAQRSWCRTSLS
jgi:hypothetical protein